MRPETAVCGERYTRCIYYQETVDIGSHYGFGGVSLKEKNENSDL